MNQGRKINLRVPFITRLEGEGSLELSAKGNDIDKVHLKIFEPPRLFERFLQGRSYSEVPDLSARICGICPMAYQLTSILAMEQLFNVELPVHLTRLRRLMNLGEWLQSHSLHIHFLAMPDYLGFDTALQMAGKYPDLLKRGMQLQETGNALMRLLGARSVHPVGLKVGGFSKLPDKASWDNARHMVSEAIPPARELLKWTANLDLPDYSHDFVSVSLKGEKSYPINGGNIMTSDGMDIPPDQYLQHFKEHQVNHSTALYSLLDGRDYLVGPLARINNNLELLPPFVKEAAEEYGLEFPSQNMFKSIQVRALECLWLLFEAQQILQQDCPSGEANVPYQVQAGECSYATEAPRGMIFHHYQIDAKGHIEQCTIIPPTSQNQARIEADLVHSVQEFGLDKTDRELKAFCEQLIRNYDPCISCSTHFLDFKMLRG